MVAQSACVQTQTYTGDQGTRLCADVGGSADAPTVILLHGGGQTRHAWGGAMKALIKAGFRVINLDCRGHGESQWAQDGDYRVGARSRDLQAIIDQQYQPFALVGASMGGITALHAACNSQLQIKTKRLRALALVDIVPRPSEDGVAHIKAFMQRHLDGFATVDQAIAAVAGYNPRKRAPSAQGIMKNLRKRENGRLYWHWDPALLQVEADQEGDEIYRRLSESEETRKLPTLLVRGLQSDVVDDKSIEEFKSVMAALEQIDIAEAGHMVVGDKNDIFNRAILDFLYQHLPQPNGVSAR